MTEDRRRNEGRRRSRMKRMNTDKKGREGLPQMDADRRR